MTREEAARTLAIWKDKFRFTEGGELVIDLAIKALEQPEPCEDTISRQAALDAVFNNAESPNKAYKAIRILPSAQPEPCDDAVSRFKVLRLIEDSSNDLADSVDNRHLQNEVKKLPPVTPKPRMGKWLINSDGYYPYCSECKTEPKSGEMTDYCPKCGAKMEG